MGHKRGYAASSIMEIPPMALTDAAIRRVKSTEKPYKLADEKGLFLLVNPNGSKHWRQKYHFGGKEKLLAHGSYPDVGLKEARERRDAARKLLANDIDPGEYRKAAKVSKATANANTFEVVARLWFADKSPEWVKSNHSRILRRLEHNVFPWLGDKPITEITTPLMLETLKRIADRGYLETTKK